MTFDVSSSARESQTFHLIVDHRVRARFQNMDDALNMASLYLVADKKVSLEIICLEGGILEKKQIERLVNGCYGMSENKDNKEANWEPGTGYDRVPGPSYEHLVCNGDGDAAVVEEVSGVEPVGDLGRDGASVRLWKRASFHGYVNDSACWNGILRNLRIGSAVGIAFGILFSVRQRRRKRSPS